MKDLSTTFGLFPFGKDTLALAFLQNKSQEGLPSPGLVGVIVTALAMGFVCPCPFLLQGQRLPFQQQRKLCTVYKGKIRCCKVLAQARSDLYFSFHGITEQIHT